MGSVFQKQIFSVLLLLTTASLSAQTTNGWQASQDVVDWYSKNRPDFNYDEKNVPEYELPKLLKSLNGKTINNKAEWKKLRRPEILELFTEHVHGRVPVTPYQESFKMVNKVSDAIGGKATLKQVDVEIRSGEKMLTIHLSLFTPNKNPKPAPVFLLISNRDPEKVDPSQRMKSEFWPVEDAIARGYGMAIFSNADVDPDNDDHFKNGIHDLLDSGERTPDAWGTIAAWAWGASRCLDYLVTDPDVDGEKVAVVGHSRGGKTALWAGATDQRFAMVVSNESGASGAAISRRCFGETVWRINKSFPHWFCSNYKNFNKDVESLPVDQHMLLALIAPRALYVTAAANDLWGDPRGQYLALFHSLPAYRLYTKNTRIPDDVPPLNTPVVSGNVGFHIRDGEHNMILKDWNWFMDFADQVYKTKQTKK